MPRNPAPPKAPSGTPEAARRLWAASKPVLGSLGADYLAGRSIVTVSASDPLRYHRHCFYRQSEDDVPGRRTAWPAMHAAVTDRGGADPGAPRDGKSVVEGQGGEERVEMGGRRIIKNK